MQFKNFATKSGEKRIYINGASAYGIKVFVRDGAVSGNYPANYPEIVIYSDNKLSQSEVDAISNRIDEFVQAAVPSDKAPTFANYEILAK